MSMKRLAILSAASSSVNGGYNGTGNAHTLTNPTPGYPNHVAVHGINVMLGGAMLSGIILVVFVLCYCCHRNGRKPETNLPYYWRDPTMALEVYTVEGQQCFVAEDLPVVEIPRIPSPQPPPPPYEEVVAATKCPLQEFDARTCVQDDTGLPSYEAATGQNVAANGYV